MDKTEIGSPGFIQSQRREDKRRETYQEKGTWKTKNIIKTTKHTKKKIVLEGLLQSFAFHESIIPRSRINSGYGTQANTFTDSIAHSNVINHTWR